MSQESVDVLSVIFWIVGFLMLVSAVWAVRKPIAYLIRGDGHRGAVVGWLADLWPIAATAYFAALLVGGLFNVLAGTPLTTGTGFASVVVFVALPVIDMALCRALLAISVEHKERLTAGQMSVLADYEPVFRHAIHIVVVVSGLLAIAALWDLDVSGYAQRSLGGKIASSLLGIGIVLLVAYMLWEIVKTAIDRRLVADGDLPSDEPRTRLRTVLPILRATLLVTIVVIAALSILAAMGFDILPLLAGAGVIGVAIGFGSQTLVRDIVSGAFFLMDDAFRLGEYIEVGDAKGRVERINLRSVFLRHHRGALNILPYGEIKRLRNTSRDWSVHVMEFRLTYDTSMLQVKKILKQIGEELSADPDYAQDMLQPLKSAGVMAAEDSAIVVRAKFTARPGNTAWVVRRVAYDKIIRAFKAAGIRFAHRQVTVDVTAPAPAAAAVAAAGAGGAVAVEPVAREGSSS
jgi:small-conductance mechanosensitive channel